MAKKITKRDYFNQILANYPLTADEKSFIEHELELLDRKSSNGEKKLSEEQKINLAIKDEILAYMEVGKSYTVTDIQKALNIKSNQKTSALVTQLKDVGKVERFEEKGKAYFRII